MSGKQEDKLRIQGQLALCGAFFTFCGLFFSPFLSCSGEEGEGGLQGTCKRGLWRPVPGCDARGAGEMEMCLRL